MALVNTVQESAGLSASKPLRARRVLFTWDAHYAAGGYAPSWYSIEDMEEIGSGNAPLAVVFEGTSVVTYEPEYVHATGKIRIKVSATGVEAANDLADLEDKTATALVIYA